MPSAPGAPRLASTRFSAWPRFPGESICSHSETSRPGITAPPECAGQPLRSAAELNGPHRLLPAAGPHARDGCDQYDWHQQTGSSASPDVRPFPADIPSPAGTTASADFCQVSPHLTMRAVGAATRQHNRHPGRPPRITTTTFPLRPPRLRDNPVDGDGLHLLEQAHPDRPAFYAVRVPRCRDSPRASFPPASQRRSCLRLGVSTTSSSRGLSPPNDRPCRAYSRRRLRRRWPGVSTRAQPWRPARAHAGPHAGGGQIRRLIRQAVTVQRSAIFLGFDCPARGHRV